MVLDSRIHILNIGWGAARRNCRKISCRPDFQIHTLGRLAHCKFSSIVSHYQPPFIPFVAHPRPAARVVVLHPFHSLSRPRVRIHLASPPLSRNVAQEPANYPVQNIGRKPPTAAIFLAILTDKSDRPQDWLSGANRAMCVSLERSDFRPARRNTHG